MANLSFDSDEANRLKSISFEGRLAKLIRRLVGRLDSRLRTGPTRVKRLNAEIVRLNERERVLMEEITGLREELSQLKKIDALEDVRQSVRRTLALIDSELSR
jgi:predicted nuclease with TOPRIM domain